MNELSPRAIVGRSKLAGVVLLIIGFMLSGFIISMVTKCSAILSSDIAISFGCEPAACA